MLLFRSRTDFQSQTSCYSPIVLFAVPPRKFSRASIPFPATLARPWPLTLSGVPHNPAVSFHHDFCRSFFITYTNSLRHSAFILRIPLPLRASMDIRYRLTRLQQFLFELTMETIRYIINPRTYLKWVSLFIFWGLVSVSRSLI